MHMQIQGVWLLQPAESWYARAFCSQANGMQNQMLQEMLRLAKHRLFQPYNGIQPLTSLSVLLTPVGDSTVQLQYLDEDDGGVAGGTLVGISLVGTGAIVDGGVFVGMAVPAGDTVGPRCQCRIGGVSSSTSGLSIVTVYSSRSAGVS